MSWLLSTGAKEALMKKKATAIHAVAASTISFGDGDGTGGRDTINDSGSGLAGFTAGDHLTIVGGTNDGVDARILSVAAGTLEVAAGTLATESAGSSRIVMSCDGGSLTDIFKNMTVMLYSGSRPSSADSAEVGTKLAQLTLNGDTFVSGAAANGLNFGDGGSLTLGEETDPVTGLDEAWEDDTPAATGSALSCWIYANTVVQGASTTAVRMVGRVATSGVECNMPAGTTITAGVPISGISIAITW